MYDYKCNLQDAKYVVFTNRYLHRLIKEHRFSANVKQLKNDHKVNFIGGLTSNSFALKKCKGKLDLFKIFMDYDNEFM